MRATLVMGFLSASFALITGAQARDMSEIEQQGYDTGWEGADEFCQDLKVRPRFGGQERRGITREFQKGCRAGFSNYIDSNRSCQRRLAEESAYREMWEARREVCS